MNLVNLDDQSHPKVNLENLNKDLAFLSDNIHKDQNNLDNLANL